MARYPKAVWRGPLPSSNYAPGPSPKIAVVIHDIEGGESSADYEFHTPGMQLSAHFVVAGPGDPVPDGQVFQDLDTDDNCYAQANGNYPPIAGIAVETSGTTATPLSPAQCESIAHLVVWAAETHGFPISGPVEHGQAGVTTHCHPDGSPDPAWGNHPCPGLIRLGQVAGIVARARALAIPVPPPPAEPPGAPRMFATDPITGIAVATDADGNFYGNGIPGLGVVTLSQHPTWGAGGTESAGTNPCVGIAWEKDTDGTWGYTYFTKPTSGKGSWGPYNRYHIRRSGAF